MSLDAAEAAIRTLQKRVAVLEAAIRRWAAASDAWGDASQHPAGSLTAEWQHAHDALRKTVGKP